MPLCRLPLDNPPIGARARSCVLAARVGVRGQYVVLQASQGSGLALSAPPPTLRPALCPLPESLTVCDPALAARVRERISRVVHESCLTNE